MLINIILISFLFGSNLIKDQVSNLHNSFIINRFSQDTIFIDARCWNYEEEYFDTLSLECKKVVSENLSKVLNYVREDNTSCYYILLI